MKILCLCLIVSTFLTGILIRPSNGRRVASVCPAQWFTAEFVILADAIIPESLLQNQLDANLTFFRDIMHFTEQEIEVATQAAISFFNNVYGLNFSQSSPNQFGQRTIGSAVMFPYIFPPVIPALVTHNRWIINGKINRNTCFNSRIGGFLVIFFGEQTVFGSYGGPQGKLVSSGDTLLYGFVNIPVCVQEAVVIQYESSTPTRFDEIDEFGILNWKIYQHVLGDGMAQGVFRVETIEEEPGMSHYSLRLVFTFPANIGLTQV